MLIKLSQFETFVYIKSELPDSPSKLKFGNHRNVMYFFSYYDSMISTTLLWYWDMYKLRSLAVKYIYDDMQRLSLALYVYIVRIVQTRPNLNY